MLSQFTLPLLPNLKKVDMVDCGLDDETMGGLVKAFPDTKFIWEVDLGFWGKLREQDKKTIDKSFEWVNIVELKERKMQTLSDGERQKVMIAKAIAQETPIILLDEPTAFADADGTECILGILREERDLGRTVIVISHDDRLDRVADHIFNLK